jgi:uncharacterized protein YggE
MAREIGQSIGPAFSITENVINYRPSASLQNVSTDAGGATESESALAAGTLSVTAQVTVRFKLQ